MLTKTTALILALGVMPVFGTAIVMADGPATSIAEEDLDVAGGTIVSVDRDNSLFTLEVTPLENTQISWNDDTTFTLDGEESTADEVLVAERLVTVEHSGGMAVNVLGMTEEERPGTPE